MKTRFQNMTKPGAKNRGRWGKKGSRKTVSPPSPEKANEEVLPSSEMYLPDTNEDKNQKKMLSEFINI